MSRGPGSGRLTARFDVRCRACAGRLRRAGGERASGGSPQPASAGPGGVVSPHGEDGRMARIKGLALLLIASLAISAALATMAQAAPGAARAHAVRAAITEEQQQELKEKEKERIEAAKEKIAERKELQ